MIKGIPIIPLPSHYDDRGYLIEIVRQAGGGCSRSKRRGCARNSGRRWLRERHAVPRRRNGRGRRSTDWCRRAEERLTRLEAAVEKLAQAQARTEKRVEELRRLKRARKGRLLNCPDTWDTSPIYSAPIWNWTQKRCCVMRCSKRVSPPGAGPSGGDRWRDRCGTACRKPCGAATVGRRGSQGAGAGEGSGEVEPPLQERAFPPAVEQGQHRRPLPALCFRPACLPGRALDGRKSRSWYPGCSRRAGGGSRDLVKGSNRVANAPAEQKSKTAFLAVLLCAGVG